MSCHADVKALSDLKCWAMTPFSKFFLESSSSPKAWTSVLLEGGLWSHQSSALHSWKTLLHQARRRDRQGLTLRFCFWARFCPHQIKNFSNKVTSLASLVGPLSLGYGLWWVYQASVDSPTPMSIWASHTELCLPLKRGERWKVGKRCGYGYHT